MWSMQQLKSAKYEKVGDVLPILVKWMQEKMELKMKKL